MSRPLVTAKAPLQKLVVALALAFVAVPMQLRADGIVGQSAHRLYPNVPGPVYPPADSTQTITLDMTNVDTVAALDQLFKPFKDTWGGYLVDETISGKVSLHIQDASFETALSALITAANPPLTYRFDGGGYHFRYLHPDNNQMYFIPLAHVSTRYVLAKMRGALTGGLQPFYWQHDPMAVQINLIMADEQRNGFLVMGSSDGFNIFKEFIRNLDQTPLAKAKAHK